MDRLTFAVLSDSLAEMRRVTSRCGREKLLTISQLQENFTIWERGILLNAACFLLDFPQVTLEIPARAFAIAYRVVGVELGHGYVEELTAAAMGGMPWKSRFPAECLHCGRSGTWRQVILPMNGLPLETIWRYERPENHMPMCRRCITRLAYKNVDARIDLVRALWGFRFEAFFQWHQAFSLDELPTDWDRGLQPLWPAAFGGPTWAEGCGGLENSEPALFFGVKRSPFHRKRLSYYLGKSRAHMIARREMDTPQPFLQPVPRGLPQTIEVHS